MNTDLEQHPLTVYARHPLSAMCGAMDPDTFVSLVERMAKRGFNPAHPILMYEGKVLDGWHRYQASLAAKDINPYIEPVFKDFEGDDEAAEDVVRDEHTRRDWTKSQRAIVEVKLGEWRGKKNGAGGPQRTEADMAEKAGVDVRTIRQAKVVQRNAIPQVQDAVESGAMSLKAAATIAKLPAAAQEDAIATPRDTSQQQPSAGKVQRPKLKIVKPEVGASKEAVAELEERIAILSEEHDRLTLRVGLDAGAYTDEERASLEQQFSAFKATISTLEVKLEAVTDSRDSLQNEVNELRKQCGIYRSQLAKQRG